MPQFTKGHTQSLKYTEEEAVEKFEEVLVQAKKKDCLSIQEAIINSSLPYSSFYYLLDKFPNLESIKKEIEIHVLARINKGSLTGEYNPTAGIWRMKQLGEKDEKHQDITSGGKEINIPPISWSE